MASSDLSEPGVQRAAVATATWPTATKDVSTFTVAPNLVDYDRARATFSWDVVTQELDGLPGGGLNIAHEAVDRHAQGARRGAVALRFIERDGASRTDVRSAARAVEPVPQPAGRSRCAAGERGSPCSDAYPPCTSLRWAPSSTAACSARCSPRSGRSPYGSVSRSARAWCSSRRRSCTSARWPASDRGCRRCDACFWRTSGRVVGAGQMVPALRSPRPGRRRWFDPHSNGRVDATSGGHRCRSNSGSDHWRRQCGRSWCRAQCIRTWRVR